MKAMSQQLTLALAKPIGLPLALTPFPHFSQIRDVGTVFMREELCSLQELNLDNNLLSEVSGEVESLGGGKRLVKGSHG
jgi:hypothetical protein